MECKRGPVWLAFSYEWRASGNPRGNLQGTGHSCVPYLFGGLLDGPGGLAQGAVHVLGADLEGLRTGSLYQVVLG